MEENEQLTFESEYNQQKKNLVPMILATIFFVHFFYSRIGLGVVYIIVCLLPLFGLVWWVFEISMIRKRLRDHNDALAVNLMRDMKITT